MSDARLALAVAVVAIALGVAGTARLLQQRRSAMRPLDLAGLPTGLVLFTDAGCRRCLRVRDVLRSGGVPFTEVAYEQDSDAFRRSGVAGVPLLVAIAPGGVEVGRVAGRLTPRALRALRQKLTADG
ncbi:MAG TPA: hypothetical protein VFY15_07225 [Acidimicrobiia bacterium]|nr:hypothetical protein [Acidimicrobiia bacterium]